MIVEMQKMAQAFLQSPRSNDHEEDLTPDQLRLEILCERHEEGAIVYVLYPGEDGVARLRRQELKAGQSWRAPWIKSSGPNAPHLIPVFANRQIIVELFPPDHRRASRSSDRHFIVEIGGGTGATPCRSVPDPATDRV